MKRTYLIAGLAATALLPAAAFADSLSIGVGFGGPAPEYSTPVASYYQPAPVYAEAGPVYQQPPWAYEGPAPVYAVPAPVYQPYYAPRSWHHWHEHYWHRGYYRDDWR